MPRATLEIPPDKASTIRKAQENCQTMRNTIFAQMRAVVGIEPNVQIPLPEGDIQKKQLSTSALVELATNYVSNRLKNSILTDLAATGSAMQAYHLSKEAIADKAQRMKSWASDMFQSDIVQRLHPEEILERAWDEVLQELQEESDTTESSAHAA